MKSKFNQDMVDGEENEEETLNVDPCISAAFLAWMKRKLYVHAIQVGLFQPYLFILEASVGGPILRVKHVI